MLPREMRKCVLVLVGVVGSVFACAPSCVRAALPVSPSDSVTARFDAANTAYQHGRYERAAEAYLRLLNDGHASGALYYNLGNTYVRLDELGSAIRHYEKARRLRPEDPRIHHSLEQARRQAGVYPDSYVPTGLERLVRAWSPRALFGVGLVLLVGGLVVVVLESRPNGAVLWTSPTACGTVIVGFLLVCSAIGVSYARSFTRHGVVIAERASLRLGPTAAADVDTTVAEGKMVEIQTTKDGWTAVRTGDSLQGWMCSSHVGEV